MRPLGLASALPRGILPLCGIGGWMVVICRREIRLLLPTPDRPWSVPAGDADSAGGAADAAATAAGGAWPEPRQLPDDA